ncbi:MAG: hypothetical protein M1122_02340 [Candidatus Marsarchaeota archaeon]|jgi:hypothetical protein|nr:hypothetical protein [Candidatus Marsarchaeota archaeon]
MAEAILNKNVSVPVQNKTNDTFEKEILDRVIKENWRGKAQNVDQSVAILDTHAAGMRKLLNTFDYEVLCMPNIILNSKNMTKTELSSYLSLLEALAIGYKHKLDNEFVNIFMTGLTLKARNAQSVTKYLDYFIQDMEKKANYYHTRADKEKGAADNIAVELEKREASLLKFLKKREIKSLRSRFKRKTLKARKFSTKEKTYASIISRVKIAAGMG